MTLSAPAPPSLSFTEWSQPAANAFSSWPTSPAAHTDPASLHPPSVFPVSCYFPPGPTSDSMFRRTKRFVFILVLTRVDEHVTLPDTVSTDLASKPASRASVPAPVDQEVIAVMPAEPQLSQNLLDSDSLSLQAPDPGEGAFSCSMRRQNGSRKPNTLVQSATEAAGVACDVRRKTAWLRLSGEQSRRGGGGRAAASGPWATSVSAGPLGSDSLWSFHRLLTCV